MQRLPIGQMLGQLVCLLLLLVSIGMALESRCPAFLPRIRSRLQRIALVGGLLLLSWLIIDRLPAFPAELLPGRLTASFFLLSSLALGELIGRGLRLAPAEHFDFVIELGFRNLGLAILVTVTLLGPEAFLAFAVVFFITSIVYALIPSALFRRRMI